MAGDGFEMFELWRRQTALMGGFLALGPAVGFVMATRLSRMAMEGGAPTAAGARETRRMVSEKVSAMMAGGIAAAQVMARMGPASGPVAFADTMVAAGEAALKPATRTLKANARRLARP